MDYTITISDLEKKALDYVMTDIDAWLTSAAANREWIAKDEIVSKNLDNCNANGIAIEAGEDAQITQAYTLGVVKKASEREAEAP